MNDDDIISYEGEENNENVDSADDVNHEEG